MWKGMKRVTQVPTMLGRILSLLEEQNQLLREVHLALTNRHAQTPRRTESPFPRRIRTGSDVFQVHQDTIAQRALRDQVNRENAASAESQLQKSTHDGADHGSSTASGINPTETPSFATIERNAP